MAISLTYTFTPGTRILSSQVNANFDTLATRAVDKTGDTMTGDLKFTDATYDIGKSGATRPRDLFTSRNAVIGGTLTVTGGFAAGIVAINDTSNASMTTGLTINQGAADDEIFALKSSDVAHGVTTLAETDTYAALAKTSATGGGLKVTGLAEDDDVAGCLLYAIGNMTGTGTNVGTVAYATINAAKRNGTGVTDASANTHLFAVRDNGNTRFLIDNGGDVFYDGTTNASAWDDHDDVALLESFRQVTAAKPNFKHTFGQDISAHAKVLAETGVVTLNDDGHHFVSTKALNGLIIDAIRQVGQQMRQIDARLIETERKLLNA